MDKFQTVHQFCVTFECIFNEILNRFDVVIGGGFNVFDCLSVRLAKVVHNAVQKGIGIVIKFCQLCNVRIVGKRL